VRIVRPTGRTLALFAGAVAASIAFAIVARTFAVDPVAHIDVALELAFHHRFDSTIGDVWAFTASFIGSNYVLGPLTLVLAWYAVHRGRRAVALVLVVDVIAVGAIGLALKQVFARTRPHLFDKLAIPTDYSFPSGHSMSAVGVWGVIAAVLVALFPRHRRLVIALVVPLVISIGLSRIYLGVHWPSDVLGGFLAGTPPLLVSVLLLHKPPRDVIAQQDVGPRK
jgi:undecaprenyl-diphosphatase